MSWRPCASQWQKTFSTWWSSGHRLTTAYPSVSQWVARQWIYAAHLSTSKIPFQPQADINATNGSLEISHGSLPGDNQWPLTVFKMLPALSFPSIHPSPTQLLYPNFKQKLKFHKSNFQYDNKPNLIILVLDVRFRQIPVHNWHILWIWNLETDVLRLKINWVFYKVITKLCQLLSKNTQSIHFMAYSF